MTVVIQVGHDRYRDSLYKYPHVQVHFSAFVTSIALRVSVTDSWWGRGFDSLYIRNFKYGLCLERGLPSLVSTDLIKQVDIIKLDGA